MTELLGNIPSTPYQFSMAYKMWFGFQFNLSDSSDDDFYRLDLDLNQWKMISIYAGSYFAAPKKNRAGVRPDTNANNEANADANRSKTICRPPLKGVEIIILYSC